MPTYDYQCEGCGQTASIFQSIGEYSSRPLRPSCPQHGEMQRRLSVVPGVGINPLAGDRHYDGLRTSEGVDISTRSKHRQYMRETRLTMASDFKGTWEKAQIDREAQRTAQHTDKELRSLVTEQVMRAVAQPD